MRGAHAGAIAALMLVAVACHNGESLARGANPDEVKADTAPAVQVPQPAEVAATVGRLANDDYAVREAASAELERLPPEAVAVLQERAKQMALSPEAQARVEAAVAALQMKALRARHPVFTGADPDKIPLTDDVITQIVPLRSIAAEQLRPDLLPLLSPDAEITVLPGRNSLIITDTSAKIHRLVDILQKLDSRHVVITVIEYRQMLNANAADAARLINAMFQPAGMGGGGARGGAAPVPGRLQAESDAKTSTVVLNGPPDQVQQALQMLERLDQAEAGPVRGAPAPPAGVSGRGTTGRGGN